MQKIQIEGAEEIAAERRQHPSQTESKIRSEDGWSIFFFSAIQEKKEGGRPLQPFINPPLLCEITESKLFVYITCGHRCVVRNETWTSAVEFSDPDTEFICH